MQEILANLTEHTGLILAAFFAAFAALGGAIGIVWKAQETARVTWHDEVRSDLKETRERLDECDRDRSDLHTEVSNLSLRLARVEYKQQ